MHNTVAAPVFTTCTDTNVQHFYMLLPNLHGISQKCEDIPMAKWLKLISHNKFSLRLHTLTILGKPRFQANQIPGIKWAPFKLTQKNQQLLSITITQRRLRSHGGKTIGLTQLAVCTFGSSKFGHIFTKAIADSLQQQISEQFFFWVVCFPLITSQKYEHWGTYWKSRGPWYTGECKLSVMTVYFSLTSKIFRGLTDRFRYYRPAVFPSVHAKLS